MHSRPEYESRSWNDPPVQPIGDVPPVGHHHTPQQIRNRPLLSKVYQHNFQCIHLPSIVRTRHIARKHYADADLHYLQWQDNKKNLRARYQVTRLDFLWLVNAILVEPFPSGVVEDGIDRRSNPVCNEGDYHCQCGIWYASYEILASHEVERTCMRWVCIKPG